MTMLQIPATLCRELSEEFRNVAWNAACCSNTRHSTGLCEVTYSTDGWYAHAFISSCLCALCDAHVFVSSSGPVTGRRYSG